MSKTKSKGPASVRSQVILVIFCFSASFIITVVNAFHEEDLAGKIIGFVTALILAFAAVLFILTERSIKRNSVRTEQHIKEAEERARRLIDKHNARVSKP